MKGYTFIEVLVTLIIISGLMLFTLVFSSDFLQKNEQQTLVDELRTAIQYAKMQAIIQGGPVALSPLDRAGNWSTGMTLIKIDKKSKQLQVLHQWQWHHPHWVLHWSGVNKKQAITLSNNPMTAISNGQFHLIHMKSQKEIVLILNRLGRVRVQESPIPG